MKETLPIPTPEQPKNIVRMARETDAEALVKLVTKGMPGYPFESVYDASAIRASIAEGNSLRIVVENAHHEIVGTAVLGDNPDYMQEIKRVVTAPEARKNGIATQMTQKLTEIAQKNGVASWMDARGDQPGMQMAAIRSGYTAISLEQGKHCVYIHHAQLNESLEKNQWIDVGPARETMVHLTSLLVDLDQLHDSLSALKSGVREKLIVNMNKALNPKQKNTDVVLAEIQSAKEVKNRIDDQLDQLDTENTNLLVTELSGDISKIDLGDITMIVIKPDASGFIYGDPTSEQLRGMIDLGQTIGLQTLTTYVDIENYDCVENLLRSGLEPTMVRVWQELADEPVLWQIGWRKTCNGFEESLHHINLAHETRKQLEVVRETVARNCSYTLYESGEMYL